MRFLVDECLSRQFVENLRNAGHDVIWAQDVCPSADDTDVLLLAVNSNRLLISQDWDFGELVMRFGLPAIGVIIVPAQAFDGSLDEIARHATRVIERFGDSCEGSLTVIEPHKTRQRKLK